MGLFDEVGKGLLGKLSGGEASNNLLDTALGLINNPDSGGLSGLVQAFKQKGLSDAVSSWIGTGENQPISPEQVQQVLGNDHLQRISEKLGLSNQDISGGLANLLPQLIDKLTPHGALPEGGYLEHGLDMLKKKILGA
jgi:uncharacterized protein YidB (DUF937 family)